MLNRSHLPTIRSGLGLAGVVLLSGLALAGTSSRPAFAQSSSWETGCAERIVQPGSGDALRVYNCSRQKDCQQLANRENRTVFASGCFGVSPSAPQVPASAVRSRPERQQ